MTEERSRPRTGLIIGLAALLVVGLAFQAREIAHLNDRLDALQTALAEKAEAPVDEVPASAARAPSSPPHAPGGPLPPGTPFGPDDPFAGLPDPFAGDPFAGHPDPFEMFDRMRQRMGLPGPAFRMPRPQTPGTTQPSSPGLTDEGDRYVVQVEVPDPAEAQTDVKLDGDTLRVTVSGPNGVTQRSTTLPGPVDPERVTTELRGDTLIVTLPKQR